jgi:hypothetical protein
VSFADARPVQPFQSLHPDSSKVVGAGQVLQVAPEAFDRIQLSTITRQPDNQDALFNETQGSQRGSTFVLRSAVQNQDEASSRVFINQQMLQKRDEGLAVLPLGNQPVDVVVEPIIGTKDKERPARPVAKSALPHSTLIGPLTGGQRPLS